MNFDLVETFLKVAESRNLTHAATRLRVTQSSVSRRISALERELGVTLFTRGRGGRDVVLTEHGGAFAGVAARWMDLWRETEDIRWSTPARVLSIASVDLVNTHTLVPFYQRYVGRQDVKLWINTHHSDEIHGLVERREADVGFVFSEVHYPDIVSLPIYQERMFVLVHESSPLPDVVSSEGLDAQHEVYLRWGSDYELWHRRHWTPDHYAIRVNTGSMLVHYLNQPNAWAIAPLSEVHAMQRHYPVRSLALTQPPPPRICYQLIHADARQGQARVLDEFTEMLRQFIAETERIEDLSSA
ncbi:MAG: LysR family transcriptional regulator [Citricoccus sp.]